MQRDEAYRRSYEAFDLQPGEVLSISWTASQGMLTLTNLRLLYEPMRTPKGLIEPLAEVAGQGALGKLISGAIDSSGALRTPWATQLSDIASVSPEGGAGLRINLRSGESHQLEIAKSLWSPRFSSANGQVRDAAVAAVQAAVAGQGPAVTAGAGSPPSAEMFAGTWRVEGIPQRGNIGTLVLGSDGRFSARFVLFGALPQGTDVAGAWWFTVPFGCLVLQGHFSEMNGEWVFPVQWLLVLNQVSPTVISCESSEDGADVPVTLTRAG